MPLYEYRCSKCGLRFEELKSSKESSAVVPCQKCGKDSVRQISAFAPVVTGGSANEPVDMKIGREANKRWQRYHDNQSKRHDGKELKNFELPKAKDGKFMPVMGLGEKKEIKNRQEYVSALQDHRKQRQEKGISQFSDKGGF
jgi:putative FmdB family regulatory protein